MNTSTLKANSISRSKSKSKIPYSPKKNAGSPSSPQKKVRLSDQANTSKMKGMRDKLCQTLDAYILIFETHSPLRCLQHNSLVSLYCETQQKLLCANCIYRSNNHKLHRVFPIQKCYKQISRDVQQMSRQIERQISWADGQSKGIIQFFKQEEKNTNQALLSIAQIYDEIHFELEKSFEQSKKKIVQMMDSIFSKKQSLLLQLQFFKNIHNNNKPIAQKSENVDASVSEYKMIFNHLIGSALVQFGKIEGNKMHENISRIKTLEKSQLYKLRQVKQIIQSWRSVSPKEEAEK